MIEILPQNQRPMIELSHGDMKLFLFSLGDGWRLPTLDELLTLWYWDRIVDFKYRHAWTKEDCYLKSTHPLLPVRDLEADLADD
jgi:hypothetical protein